MPKDKNYFRKNPSSNTTKPYVYSDGLNNKMVFAVPIENPIKSMRNKNPQKVTISAVRENPETRLLNWEITDLVQKSTEKRSYRYSRHCLQRAAQRGIQADAIAITLEFGRVYFRQGMFFHVLGKKELPNTFIHEWERLRHTVVVLSGDDFTLITAYRADNPFRKIRRKSKVLLTHYQSIAA
jgi:hypothetical protein